MSERLSDINPILSFLRIPRNDHEKPGHCVGLSRFWRSKKPDSIPASFKHQRAKGMFARTVAIGLILLPLMAGAGQEEAHLDLTPKAFQSGMGKHLKEIPQCSAATLDKGQVLKDGKAVYQTLKMNGASVVIILDVGTQGKIANAKFTGAEGAKNDAQLRAMMCSTYAIMRTLQPEYESSAQAQSNMNHLWASAAAKPFTKAFYFNTIKAQYVPFEMNVY